MGWISGWHRLALTIAIGVIAWGSVVDAAAALTDPSSLQNPGRHEVMIPGAGVALDGVLFRPAEQGPLPAVIVLHGWSYQNSLVLPSIEGRARELSERGYVALAVVMRGWPKSGGFDDCGQKQPDDIARAAEWLSGVPGVDADRVGVLGFSQGGQVALLTSARSSRIKAVVAYYPVTDTERWGETSSLAGIRNEYVPRTCGNGVGNSPLRVADKIAAPVLLIHGDKDTRVPTEQSLRLRDALQGLGRRVELVLVPGAQHGFSAAQGSAPWKQAVEFFDTNLKPLVSTTPAAAQQSAPSPKPSVSTSAVAQQAAPNVTPLVSTTLSVAQQAAPSAKPLVAAVAQPPAQSDPKWLLGEWAGTQKGGTGATNVDVEFKERTGEIQWELFVKDSYGLSRAVGTAIIADNVVTMNGKYTSGAAAGNGLSYSLTRNGEGLTGTGRGMSPIEFVVSWKKSK